MKKNALIFAILFLTVALQSQESLRCSNPLNFKSGVGTITSATLVIKPNGHFLQLDYYLEYGGTNFYNTYTDKDTLEITHYFNMPENAAFIDSWLWVEDNIMKAMILDRGSAFNIYEGIVQRRRDPSILYKNSKTQYEFRIFPLPFGKERKVKISILLPTVNDKFFRELIIPTNLLKSSKTVPSLKVIAYKKDIQDVLKLSTGETFFEGTDSTFGEFQYATISAENIKNGGSINLTMQRYISQYPEIYINNSLDDDEGYYQALIDPNSFIDDARLEGNKVLIGIDYNMGTTNYTKSEVLNSVKQYITNNLNHKDSIKIYYNNFGVVKHLNKWTSVNDIDINTSFDNIMLGNTSVINSLLYESYSNLKNNEENSFLVLFTSNINFNTATLSQQLKNELVNNLGYLDRTYILDFTNYNLHQLKTIYNSVTYFGAELLYKIITSNSNGGYVMLNPQNINLTFQSGISSLTKIIRTHNVSASEYELRPTTGLCYDNVKYEIDGKILQVGKYKGDLPFILNTTTIYKNEILDYEFVFNNKMESVDNSKNEFIQAYYGQKLKSLETMAFTNSLKSIIIDLSIENRVLSLYTAFLALEPSLQTPCMGCLDESQTTGSNEENINKIVINASPNPFIENTIISINGAENVKDIKDLYLCNLNGTKLPNSILRIEKNNKIVQIVVDGSSLSNGIYYLKFIYKGKLYTYKLIKVA